MVDIGKLQVFGRVGLHVSPWAVPKPSRPGLAKRGSLSVPIPGEDITLCSSAHTIEDGIHNYFYSVVKYDNFSQLFSPLNAVLICNNQKMPFSIDHSIFEFWFLIAQKGFINFL